MLHNGWMGRHGSLSPWAMGSCRIVCCYFFLLLPFFFRFRLFVSACSPPCLYVTFGYLEAIDWDRREKIKDSSLYTVVYSCILGRIVKRICLPFHPFIDDDPVFLFSTFSLSTFICYVIILIVIAFICQHNICASSCRRDFHVRTDIRGVGGDWVHGCVPFPVVLTQEIHKLRSIGQ